MENHRLLGHAGKRLAALTLSVWLCGCTSMRHALYQDPLTADEHVTLANTYLQQNQKELAEKQYEAALRKDRKYSPALMALGNMAYENKDWEKARTYFKRALKARRGDPGALNNLAMVDMAEGKNLDQAVERVENALHTAAGLRPYLLDTLANLAIRQGRMKDAEVVLDQAQREAPSNDPEFKKQLEASRQRLANAQRK